MKAEAVPLIARDLALDFLLFPVWWYATGLKKMLRYASGMITGYARLLGIAVWLNNLFVPMFGQYDWQSRIISVFMRLVQIVFRTFGLAAVVLAMIGAVALYLLALPVLVVFALWQIVSLVYVGI